MVVYYEVFIYTNNKQSILILISEISRDYRIFNLQGQSHLTRDYHFKIRHCLTNSYIKTRPFENSGVQCGTGVRVFLILLLLTSVDLLKPLHCCDRKSHRENSDKNIFVCKQTCGLLFI